MFNIKRNIDNKEYQVQVWGNVYPIDLNILSLYQQYGVDCVKHVNGEYAFAVYDPIKNIVFCAVDRMGCKTLYYHTDSLGIECGTTLLPLCKGKSYHIDGYARQCYFAMQYIPSPHTIVAEVRKLNPGERLIYSLATGEPHIESYWDLYDNTCGFETPESYDEALQTSEKLIRDSLHLRLQTHATNKIGTFLSGGIDSSLVTMLASQEINNLESFSVGFEENQWDESEYAKQIAAHLGARFNHIVCSSEDAIRVVDGLQNYYDEPMGDASMIPTSLLCEKTGEKIDTALGGDGGDEVFFGYPRYLRYANRAWMYRLPNILRQPLAGMCDMVGKKRLATSLRMRDVQELYMNRRSSNQAELFDATKIQQSLEQCKYLYANQDVRRCFNDFDIRTLMAHAYNVKLDRAAMRAGLNVRVPLLDYKVVEYSRLLPIEYCYTEDMGQKRILRDLLYQKLPRELFERRKQGFGVPVGEWFRGPLKDYLIDMVNHETAKLLPDFDAKRLIEVRDKHIAGVENQTTLLWLCCNYVAWYKIYNR